MMHLPKIIPCSLSMKIGGIFMSIFIQCELFDIKNVKLHNGESITVNTIMKKGAS